MNNRVIAFKKLRKTVPATNPGNRFVDEYKLSYDDLGQEELVVVGKKDVYSEIQSHADSVDVHKIIERCTMTGSMDELYKTEGFFGDLASFPTTRAEALRMLADAHSVWDKLPVDVKKKFDSDVNKFFSTAFSEEWIEKLKIPNEVINEKKEGEVIE